MTEKELIELIKQGEGQQLEFKAAYAKDIPNEICAFANADGGVLLIGVADDGSIQGCDYNNTKASNLQNSLDKIDPPPALNIEKVFVKGKIVVAIHCPKPKGEKRVYTVSGNIYIRKGPNTQKLTSTDEITRFMQYANAIHFDEKPCTNFVYPDQFDVSRYDQFSKLSGLATVSEDDRLTVLQNLRLTNKDNIFKNAAVLLFAKDVQRIFDHAKIRVVQFRGTNKVNIHNDQPILGTVYEQFHNCIHYLKTILNTEYIIEDAGPRKEILELPEAVLREALVNALAHRSYYETGACIMVEIYDDRVEITNPGGLVPSISPDEFGKRSASRNPLLFSIFQRMRLVEQVGSGIERMRQAMTDQGLPEPEFSYDGMFIVKLARPVEFDKWIKNWTPNLNQTQIKILRSINDDPGITIAELSKNFRLASSTINKHLRSLKEIGLIKRIGSLKTGQWKINYMT